MDNDDLATFVPRLECFQHQGKPLRGRHVPAVIHPRGYILEVEGEEIVERWGIGAKIVTLVGPDDRGAREREGKYKMTVATDGNALLAVTPTRVVGVAVNGQSMVGKLGPGSRMLAFEWAHAEIEWVEVQEKKRWLRSGAKVASVTAASMNPIARINTIVAMAFPDGWDSRAAKDDLDAFSRALVTRIANHRLDEAHENDRPHLRAALEGRWTRDEADRVAWFVNPDSQP